MTLTSRNAIGHVTNGFAICHFLLVSNWNRTCYTRPCPAHPAAIRRVRLVFGCDLNSRCDM